MKIGKLVSFILLGIVLFSCKKDQSVSYIKYETGEIKEKIVFNDFKKQITRIVYNKSGSVIEEMVYENGLLEGNYKSFYDNGTVKDIVPYKMGVVSGKIFNYDNEGNLIRKKTVMNNRLHGLTEVFFENGEKREEQIYIDGKKVSFKVFYISADGELRKFVNHDLKNNKFVKNGQLVTNTTRKEFDKKKCLYYSIELDKDTVKIGEKLEAKISFINRYSWKLNAKIGELDSCLNFILPAKQFEGYQKLNVILPTETSGINHFMGMLAVQVDTIIGDKAIKERKEFVLFKEYFVE